MRRKGVGEWYQLIANGMGLWRWAFFFFLESVVVLYFTYFCFRLLTLFHTGEKNKYFTMGKLKTPLFICIYFNRVKSNLPYKLLVRLVLVKSMLPYIVHPA